MEMPTSTTTRQTHSPRSLGRRREMALLPVELLKTDRGVKAAADIDLALKAARKRLRLRRTLNLVASTLAAPLAAAALWVALFRFTLLDLPQWPIILFVAVWALMLMITSLRQRVPYGQSARYLDRA